MRHYKRLWLPFVDDPDEAGEIADAIATAATTLKLVTDVSTSTPTEINDALVIFRDAVNQHGDLSGLTTVPALNTVGVVKNNAVFNDVNLNPAAANTTKSDFKSTADIVDDIKTSLPGATSIP